MNMPEANPVALVLKSATSSIFNNPTFSFSVVDNSSFSPSTRNVKDELAQDIHDHPSAFAHFLTYLKAEANIDRSEIVHVCHRIVHGGDYYKPQVITEQSYHYIEQLSDLAPLSVYFRCFCLNIGSCKRRHNGSALSVIKACMNELPKATSIAYFDTSFHHDLPEYISAYAIHQEIAKKKDLKKYGFHGLSCWFLILFILLS